MKFFHKVKGTIHTATRKSQDAIEINKLNQQIRKHEHEVSKLYQLIGQKVFQDREFEKEETKEYVQTQVQNIQCVQDQMDVLRRKILFLKDLIECESCRKVVSLQTKFCPDCGNHLADSMKKLMINLTIEE